MKKTSFIFAILCGLFSLMSAQNSEDEMMAKWMEAMTPGDNHAWLAEMAGDWIYTQTVYMDPNKKPDVEVGKCTARMTMGGRYLEENMTGNSWGMPFEGQNITAFDNINGKFQTVWNDNMGTSFMIGEGSREGNVLTVNATYPDFDGGTQRFKMVTEVINKDKHTFEMYTIDPDGKEFMHMEIVYERK